MPAIEAAFLKVVGRAGFHRRVVDLALSLAGQQNHGRLAVPPEALADQFQAVPLAEPVVDQDQIVLVGADDFDGLVEVGHPLQNEVGLGNLGEKVASEDVVVLVVIDQQDSYQLSHGSS